MNKKMADIDIDPFGEHHRTEEPTDKNIPLSLVGPGGLSTWKPECERETSFGGKSLETLKYKTLESFVKSLYKRLSGCDDEPPETINFDNFDLRNGQLYYIYIYYTI